jgi:hypothetical protein
VGNWPAEVKKQWDPAMELGDAGRAAIKGHALEYCRKVLQDTREKSLKKFAGARRWLADGGGRAVGLGTDQ